MAKKKNEHVIKEVYPGSIAEEMEIEQGMCFCQSIMRRSGTYLITGI